MEAIELLRDWSGEGMLPSFLPASAWSAMVQHDAARCGVLPVDTPVMRVVPRVFGAHQAVLVVKGACQSVDCGRGELRRQSGVVAPRLRWYEVWGARSRPGHVFPPHGWTILIRCNAGPIEDPSRSATPIVICGGMQHTALRGNCWVNCTIAPRVLRKANIDIMASAGSETRCKAPRQSLIAPLARLACETSFSVCKPAGGLACLGRTEVLFEDWAS
jgi:hypothetical protein